MSYWDYTGDPKLFNKLAGFFADKITHLSETDIQIISNKIIGADTYGSNESDQIRRLVPQLTNEPEPFNALGRFIFEVMSKIPEHDIWGEINPKRKTLQQEIDQELVRFGLHHHNGNVSTEPVPPVVEYLEEKNYFDKKTVKKGVTDACKSINSNPNQAILDAAKLLESVLKQYIERHDKNNYKNDDALNDLWNKFVKKTEIHPQNKKDSIKKISSSLYQIVQGSAELRNECAAHGGTEEEREANQLPPRFARLVVNAVFTLSLYVLEREIEDSK